MKRIIQLSLLCAIIFAILVPTSAFAATVGSAYTTPDSGWARYDDQDSRINYGGATWTTRTNDGLPEYMSSVHFTYDSNGYIVIKFTGTGLRLITSQNTSAVTAAPVTVDGVSYGTFSENQGTSYVTPVVVGKYQLLALSLTGLQDTTHTVIINNQTGSYGINLDAVEVYGGILLDANDTIAPVAPINLAVNGQTVVNGHSSSVTLTWTANTETDLAGYNIYMNGSLLNTSIFTGETHTVTGLDENITYSFQITAMDIYGNESLKSNIATANAVSDRAILTITLTNGLEKEYDLSMGEINAFIAWYDTKDSGVGPSKYAFVKTWNKGPFKARTEYVIFDKILTLNVDEYEPVEE